MVSDEAFHQLLGTEIGSLNNDSREFWTVNPKHFQADADISERPPKKIRTDFQQSALLDPDPRSNPYPLGRGQGVDQGIRPNQDSNGLGNIVASYSTCSEESIITSPSVNSFSNYRLAGNHVNFGRDDGSPDFVYQSSTNLFPSEIFTLQQKLPVDFQDTTIMSDHVDMESSGAKESSSQTSQAKIMSGESPKATSDSSHASPRSTAQGRSGNDDDSFWTAKLDNFYNTSSSGPTLDKPFRHMNAAWWAQKMIKHRDQLKAARNEPGFHADGTIDINHPHWGYRSNGIRDHDTTGSNFSEKADNWKETGERLSGINSAPAKLQNPRPGYGKREFSECENSQQSTPSFQPLSFPNNIKTSRFQGYQSGVTIHTNSSKMPGKNRKRFDQGSPTPAPAKARAIVGKVFANMPGRQEGGDAVNLVETAQQRARRLGMQLKVADRSSKNVNEELKDVLELGGGGYGTDTIVIQGEQVKVKEALIRYAPTGNLIKTDLKDITFYDHQCQKDTEMFEEHRNELLANYGGNNMTVGHLTVDIGRGGSGEGQKCVMYFVDLPVAEGPLHRRWVFFLICRPIISMANVQNPIIPGEPITSRQPIPDASNLPFTFVGPGTVSSWVIIAAPLSVLGVVSITKETPFWDIPSDKKKQVTGTRTEFQFSEPGFGACIEFSEKAAFEGAMMGYGVLEDEDYSDQWLSCNDVSQFRTIVPGIPGTPIPVGLHDTEYDNIQRWFNHLLQMQAQDMKLWNEIRTLMFTGSVRVIVKQEKPKKEKNLKDIPVYQGGLKRVG